MNRFVDIRDDEIENLVNRKHSKNTKQVIDGAFNVLNQFCKKENVDASKLSKHDLDKVLAKFWPSLRTLKGSSFKSNSLKSMHYGVVSYLKKLRQVDINGEAEFTKSNEVYKAVLVSLKKEGHGETEHKEPVSSDDLKKLYDHPIVFSTENPTGLLNKVFFEIMLYLCRRGRENLRAQKRDTFAIKTDSTGRRYVTQLLGELDKNHREGARPNETIGEGRMYEVQGSASCPVKSFEKYLSKLHPQLDSLWQRPLNSFDPTDDVWYCKAALGIYVFMSFRIIIYAVNVLKLK